ncbi:MAG: hypothetical protein BHV88_01150 [Clostridiales bacterium 41_12_two_minus]|nr:MAG: hypothetical protein BHV88_01150 [Clostridiales bacterium 41_12_two_minus]
MKRSELNSIIEDTIKFMEDRGLPLPPFAYWGVPEWKAAGKENEEIVENMLGWDITDFGSGDFEKIGLTIFTFRNGNFYKKDKYELLESGTKWMSSTPDVKGSKYPTSSYPRIFTYAILKEKSTGEKFLYINTHFDHKSAEARKFQAGVLADFVSKNSEYRILLTGDFNCASTENTFGVIKNTGFKSSADVAFVKENLGATFHNYGSSSKVLD